MKPNKIPAKDRHPRHADATGDVSDDAHRVADAALITELAHAIQNQLSLITGYASILKMNPGISAEDQQSLANINSAALAAGHAVRELASTASRISRGR